MLCKLIFATIAVYLCFSPYNVEAKKVRDHEWDILIFAQIWPVSFCEELQKYHAKKCNMPSKRDSWSIHGIWPTKLGTIRPGFCNRIWLFDPEQVKPIENELIQFWTKIDAGKAYKIVVVNDHVDHLTICKLLHKEQGFYLKPQILYHSCINNQSPPPY